MERQIVGAAALAEDFEGASVEVDVVGMHGGDLRCPETLVRGQENHHPRPPIGARGQQRIDLLLRVGPGKVRWHDHLGEPQRGIVGTEALGMQEAVEREVGRSGCRLGRRCDAVAGLIASEVEHRRVEQCGALPCSECTQDRSSGADGAFRPVAGAQVVGVGGKQIFVVHGLPLIGELSSTL
ncbi:hypothetical protein KAE78_11400 [Microbacterium sp. NIBRBAC000506063]|nr:hypothetical protein [Microbacterium sp. NIBRBAC000506063]QTV80733.1 hypothetical protein KAE78_11400 [Microbacterium sp. NIBRBAC000506063]